MKNTETKIKDGNGKGNAIEDKEVIEESKRKQTVETDASSALAVKLVDVAFTPDNKQLLEFSSITHSEQFNMSLLGLSIASNKDTFELGDAPEIWMLLYLRLSGSVGGHKFGKAQTLIEQQLSLQQAKEEDGEPDIGN